MQRLLADVSMSFVSEEGRRKIGRETSSSAAAAEHLQRVRREYF